jgi:molybdopterin-containing oxidoreductase family membrane subunit
MMIEYAEMRSSGPQYWSLLLALALIAALGIGAAHHMDVEGHHITGMNNQIVWGLPHVFAIFLIVAASGALNLASLNSVFGKSEYKPLARFSAVLSIALLIGGLAILLLDLGRPDRLIVAVTHYNFKSIFAWNIILYSGFVVIVLAYLWLMMERRLHRWSRPIGIFAFAWRLLLTTGTGSIFGFLAAREAYDTALLAPLFIVMSFAFGLAVFILLLLLSFRLDRRELDISHLQRLRRLLGIFVIGILYFVLLFHLTKLYSPQNHAFERFILLDSGYSAMFWLGQIGLGSLLPLLLLYAPGLQQSAASLVLASGLVIVGGFAQLYVIIVGGQAFPLDIFPGYRVDSSFFDGAIGSYSPSLWELLLGCGGFTAALLIALLGVRVLPILPRSLPPEETTA